MPFNHPFTTLANWDGKLYQANTSPSSSRHLVNSPSRLHRKEARRTLPEEKHRQLMPPPPPVLTSTGERQISGFDMMAMSPTSPDSFLTDSEDDRKYVAGMLLETDEARASSPAKPDHHWQVPISMVSPITDAAESAWPSSKASTSSSYLKHQSLTHNNPFMNIVVVSSNPIPQNPLSPSRKPPTHTQQEENINAPTISQDVNLSTTEESVLQRELSVVPETPWYSPPQSAPTSPAEIYAPRQPSALPEAPATYDTAADSARSSPPASRSASFQVGEQSSGESTLVEPQVLHISVHKPEASSMRFNTPTPRARNDAEPDSSPLSSPPVSESQRPRGVQRHDTPAGSLPRAKVYVEISPLSVGLKREHFRPLSAYPFRPPTSQTLTNSQLSQKQRAPLKKRKRPEKTPRSPNARSPPAKRKRKDISVVSFSVSRRDIGLESLGHEARDVLKPFHDYVVMDVSDVEETIEDRFLDATSLDAALRPMLRHLYAARGVSRRDTEYYGAAKHPSPSRRSQSPPTYASEPSSSRASGRFPTDLESLPFASCASSGITRTVSHDMSANPLGLADERLACARGQQLLAVRGLDAFLGVEDDSHEQEVYAHNHGPVAALPGLLPHEASEAVPWAHLNSFLDPQDSSLSPMTPYFGHGENVTSYTENGTINPSLLAPSGNTNQFRTPSPSPPPVSMSAVRSRSVSIVETTPYQTEGSDSDSDSDYIEDQRSKSRRAIEIGKERAYDAVRARETQSGLVEISELPGMVVGKRPRKPSAKAQEALHTTDQQDSRLSVSKTMIDHARSSSDAPSHEHARSEKSVGILQKVTPAAKQKKPKRIVGDGRYCHQCRNQNNYDKVQCSSIRADGLPCALLFCEKCILKRYSHILFDSSASDFMCPKCADICNCTSCARIRGEKYVSTKHIKTGLELAARKTARKPKRKKASESDEDIVVYDEDECQTDVQSDIQIAVPATLSVGEHFGAVYDLSGRKRMGVGVVTDNLSQKIVLRRSGAEPLLSKQARKRTFIGLARPTWRSKVVEDAEPRADGHAYVGKREPLLNSAWYHSFDAHMCFEGALTPTSSDLEDDSNRESPSKPLDSAQLSFALADLLTNTLPPPVPVPV